MKLEGRIGLVTGSSRGIGRGCAVEMAREGAKVAINYPFDSELENAQATAKEVEEVGGEAILIKTDVSDQAAVEQMVQTVVDQWGRLDMFVSNAVYSDREPLLTADMDGIHKTINVSLLGAFYGLRAAGNQMAKQGDGGAMVIIGSPHAHVPVPNTIAYNMAKAANDIMAKTAALELSKHNIRVNIVHPGWTDTPGERKFASEDTMQNGQDHLPIPRLGTIYEIGKAAVYELSDDAAYMTGSTVTVDGGFQLPWWDARF